MKKIAAALLLTPLALACSACQQAPATPPGQSATSSATVGSAASQTLTAAEVGAIYQDLAMKGMDIDNDFAGYTEPAGTSVTVNGATYYPFPKYASLEALRAAVETVFTPSYAEQIFSGPAIQGGPDYPATFIYYNGALYKCDGGGWGGEGSADLSTIRITSQTADAITFHADVPNEVGEIYSADFRLVNVDGSWRLDCPVSGNRSA